jgi:hypothetical protein
MEMFFDYIIFDIDDTLIEWTTPYIKWLFKNKIHLIDTHQPYTWFDRDFIREFNLSKHFIKRKLIKENYKEFEKWSAIKQSKIILLTACGDYAENNLTECLDLLNVNADDTIVVNDSHEKYDIILEISKMGSVLVYDDKLETRRFCRDNKILAFDLNRIVRS